MQGVSGNFFGALGVGAARGRVLLPSDAAHPGREAVAVLSNRAWIGRFAADSAVIGRVLHVNGQSLQVVGIASTRFDGMTGLPPDMWVPITLGIGIGDQRDPFAPDAPDVVRVIGRLRPGVSESSARRALAAWGGGADTPAPSVRARG